MAEINSLNVVDADNTARFPENQLPSTVNNGARALEGIIARWDKDTNASLSAGGSANAITISANQTLSAYYDGLVIAFEAGATNTGAVTINVDSVGVKSLKKNVTEAISAGEIISGQKVIAIYDGTNFQIVSAFSDTTETSLAAEWASKTDGIVASSDYSSKAYAIGGTGVTDTAGKGAAKEWATAAEDDTVDGSEYSAKHYSTKASASASSASSSASGASTSASNASTSASNASTSASSASSSATAAAAAAASNLYSSITNTSGTVAPSILNDDGTLFVIDTSGGAGTVNLPAIGTSEGVRFAFVNDSGSNNVTINRNGSDTINGGTSLVLTADTQFVTLISDDASPDNWVALAGSTITAGSGLAKTGETISIADNGVVPAMVQGTINSQTATTYTLVLGDAFKTVTMTNASANTVTIPPNSSVAFAVGDRIDIVMLATGVTSVVGGSGVTVNGVSTGTGAIAAQYGAVSCLKIATDTWLLMGNHGGVA